jgi:hypothetical protein
VIEDAEDIGPFFALTSENFEGEKMEWRADGKIMGTVDRSLRV